MSKITLRTAVLAALLVGLVALPALAQPNVPPGKDFWVTPANGQTFFTFPAGDVEALCGAPVSATWNHVVTFTGVNLSTSTVTAYDTMIARLDNAVFNTNGVATTRVQVQALSFRSTATTSTPCGPLNWNAGLAGVQNTSQMTIRRTSATGGVFFAELFINAELKAYNASTGVYVGSLFYTFRLPDPAGGAGTAWSFGPGGVFRAGMTPANNCIDVLRQKLNQYSPSSSHFYFISDMIAQGQCYRQ